MYFLLKMCFMGGLWHGGIDDVPGKSKYYSR